MCWKNTSLLLTVMWQTVLVSFMRFTCGFNMQSVYFLLKGSCVFRQPLIPTSIYTMYLHTVLNPAQWQKLAPTRLQKLCYFYLCLWEEATRKWVAKSNPKNERGTGKEQKGLFPRLFFFSEIEGQNRLRNILVETGKLVKKKKVPTYHRPTHWLRINSLGEGL